MKRIILCLLALAVLQPARAQLQVTPALIYGAKETKKKERVFPIFWSAARKELPPLPFNPFPELKVYDAGTNNFIYDDREVDYPALEAAMAMERAQTEAEAKTAALAKDAGGGGTALMSMSGGLRLGPLAKDGTNLLMAIEGAEEGGRYDVYYSTNLTEWHYLLRTATNQTNLTILPPAQTMCFFQLGTLQDTDLDTLPDAFENLITQTDPNAANTLANAGGNTKLTAWLTDQPPHLFLKTVLKVFGYQPVSDPCLWPDVQVDRVIDKTVWDSATGGYETRFFNRKVCLLSGLVEITEESVTFWAPDDTGCFLARFDGGPWSVGCTNEDGIVPASPRHGPYGTDWDHETSGEFPPGSGAGPVLMTTKIKETLQLDTRGPGLSTKSRLYRLSARIQAWQPDGLTYTNAPPDQISMLGQTLDADYRTYVMLPDNTSHDLTPKLLSACTTFAFFDVGAERIDVKIKRSDENITGQRLTVNAGELVSLTCVLDPPLATITNYTWVIPGQRVADYVITSQTGKVYALTNFSDANIAYYWWRPATELKVQCSVVVQGFTIAAEATFDVYSPNFPVSSSFQDIVRVDSNNGHSPNGELHLGTLGVSYGIVFFGPGGDQFNWLQVINGMRRARLSTTGQWEKQQGQGLDNIFPYPIDNPYQAQDTPGLAAGSTDDGLEVKDSFQMYLMYKPPSANSINVPMRQVNWGWRGSALRQNGVWSLLPEIQPTTGPTVVDPTGFPEWENRFQDIQFVPENP